MRPDYLTLWKQVGFEVVSECKTVMDKFMLTTFQHKRGRFSIQSSPPLLSLS